MFSEPNFTVIRWENKAEAITNFMHPNINLVGGNKTELSDKGQQTPFSGREIEAQS
jgi:hypothetical protein